ncbi:MAG: AraC family transcriptional regulator [Lachnospiraceae bacterium]|nr:AraC family transcriptional regulator [Lachnospiraceae bacterium]
MDQQPSILKEVRPHGTKSFPCAIYRTHSVGKGTLVKHHWHDEAEILYFSGGEFRLEINMESFQVCSECLYFINPGELHSIITESSDHHWEDAVVFAPGILSFGSYDEAQIHLIKSIRSGWLLFPRCIMPEHPAFVPIRNAFMQIMHSFEQSAADDFPMEYINEYRIKQTRRLLEESDLSVTEICLEGGFNNLGNFLREFRKYTGTTPAQYRKAHAEKS